MVKAPPVPSSLTDTFLVSSSATLDFLLLPVELSSTPLTGAQHSEEARLPEWVQEVLPEEVSPEGALLAGAEVLLVLFPPEALAAGAGALVAAATTASR